MTIEELEKRLTTLELQVAELHRQLPQIRTLQQTIAKLNDQLKQREASSAGSNDVVPSVILDFTRR